MNISESEIEAWAKELVAIGMKLKIDAKPRKEYEQVEAEDIARGYLGSALYIRTKLRQEKEKAMRKRI